MSQYNADRPLGPVGETIRRDRVRPLTNSMLREAMQKITRRGPRKVGDGVGSFSTCTTVDRQPFRWDSNCFYRRLGLDTSATRVDIVRAFLELDPRQDFVRLAVAAEVLLSKSKRSLYDHLILGTFYARDPALIKSRLGGQLTGTSGTWVVYADPEVSDEDAMTLTSDWRNRLSAALAPRFEGWPMTPHIGVGVCTSIFRSRWEMVGNFAIYFVPLDCEATPQYVHAAADELLRMATPTVISDS